MLVVCKYRGAHVDWINFFSAIAGAIVGGSIAGFFSLKATQKSHQNELDKAKESEEKLISGFLQAIHDEIETVYDRYQESMGARLESLDDGNALTFYYPLVSDFFTVYNGNSFLLGRISGNDLRKQIIKTYTVSKGLVDSFRMNNDLVSKYEFSERLYAETKLDVHKDQSIAHYQALVEYAKTLKELHRTLKQEVSLLLRELRKNGVLNEKGN